MKPWIVVLGSLLLLAITASLVLWRYADRRAEDRAWKELRMLGSSVMGAFDPAGIRDLPLAAQRYFRFMIDAGAPLYTSVELDMVGQLGMGSKESPNYAAMSARQILSPPHGLLWRLKWGLIAGSDASLPTTSWTRFWFAGLVPVVRVSSADHRRSAFGRVVVEAATWVPASLLPGEWVYWEALSDDSARAVVSFDGLKQAVDITVDEEGAPLRVVIQRWSNENPEKIFREQPFGADLSEYKRFGGYRLPTRIAVGNHYGTTDFFPFLSAEIKNLRFPKQR